VHTYVFLTVSGAPLWKLRLSVVCLFS
jgi:hypothetical protein